MKTNATLTALLVTLAATGTACASSEDDWAAFRKAVATACLAKSGDLFVAPAIAVDPFGSQRFGLALLTGPAKGAEDKTISAICVYDKQAKTAEVGGELPEATKAE